AARQHRHAFRPRQSDGALRLRDGSRRGYAERHHLVVRSVGRVPSTREAIEPDVAADLALEPMLQSGRRHYRHVTLTAIEVTGGNTRWLPTRSWPRLSYSPAIPINGHCVIRIEIAGQPRR